MCALKVLCVTGTKLEFERDLIKAVCVQTKEFASSQKLQLALKNRHEYKSSSLKDNECAGLVCTKQSGKKCENVKRNNCGPSNAKTGGSVSGDKNRLTSTSSNSATSHAGGYTGYKVYKVTPKNNAEFESLIQMRKGGVDFWREPTREGSTCEFMLSPEQQRQYSPRTRSDGLHMEETLADLQQQIKKTKATKAVRKGELTWDAFYDGDDIYAFIKNMETKYPDNAKVIKYGESYEQRELNVIAISKSHSASASLPVKKPIFFIECNIHAREWISAAFCTFIINELLVDKKECISKCLEHFDFYLIPIANPDGYAYSHKTSRIWRKTTSPVKSSAWCNGTDPNRNFDDHWGEADTSTNPCHESFGGSGPASESEVKNLQNYLLRPEISSRLRVYLAVHSHYSAIFWPWSYAAVNISAERYKFFWDTSQKAVEAIAKRYGTVYKQGPSAQIYDAISGSADDWTYANVLEHKTGNVYVATFELRTTSDGFIIKGDAILPHSLEVMDGFCVIGEAVAGSNGGRGSGMKKPVNPQAKTEDVECDE